MLRQLLARLRLPSRTDPTERRAARRLAANPEEGHGRDLEEIVSDHGLDETTEYPEPPSDWTAPPNERSSD